MEHQEFLKDQYLTLRDEIRDTKNRIFKTMGFGLVVVPGSHFLAQAYKLDTVILSLPILVVVVALIYLSENNALMRCGRFIRHHIEPKMTDIVGWEEWLERKGSWDARSVDKYLSYAFYLLFLVYFAGSVFIAARFAVSTYGVLETGLLLGAYVAIGVWFVIYLIRNVRVSTIMDADLQPPPNSKQIDRTVNTD
jgi:hypothetical protein